MCAQNSKIQTITFGRQRTNYTTVIYASSTQFTYAQFVFRTVVLFVVKVWKISAEKRSEKQVKNSVGGSGEED